MQRNYFKDRHSFNKRCEESNRIMSKYKTKKPVIVEKKKYQKDVPDIDRTKYLVPDDLTMAEFMYIIRKRIQKTIPNALSELRLPVRVSFILLISGIFMISHLSLVILSYKNMVINMNGVQYIIQKT